MLESIENTYNINEPDKIRRYYSIFINTTAAIAKNFSAKIIKNTGTGLIYYFPKTSDLSLSDLSAFKDVLECGITTLAAKEVINRKLSEEGLPSLHYKVSADYGKVEVARSNASPESEDLFGSTMNICSKINTMASPDSMVIGSDFYYIVKRFASSPSESGSQYIFKRIGEYSIASNSKYQYPVYSVAGEVSDINLDLSKQIPKLQKSTLNTTQIQDINHYVPSKVQSQRPEREEVEQQRKNIPTKIMIVDDEKDALLTYKAFLDNMGYKVDAFSDSQEALKHFAHTDSTSFSPSSYYELVIMDIRMPGLNGLQLYYRINAINPNVRVLFVSALNAAEELVSILPGVRVEDVIRKPVQKEQFLHKVKVALEP
jgi:CheY-like chemotaxis protein